MENQKPTVLGTLEVSLVSPAWVWAGLGAPAGRATSVGRVRESQILQQGRFKPHQSSVGRATWMSSAEQEEQSQSQAEHGRSSLRVSVPFSETHGWGAQTKQTLPNPGTCPAPRPAPHSPTAAGMLCLLSTSGFHHPGPWGGSDHGPGLNHP